MIKKIILSTVSLIALYSSLQAELDYCILKTTPQSYSNIAQAVHYEANKQGVEMTQKFLYISIADRKLYYFENDQLVKSSTISTSKNAYSVEEGSLGTPLALHKIADKIGDNQPIGTVFQSRAPIGKNYTQCVPSASGGCSITTRIMRLRGFEQGYNAGQCAHKPQKSCDSYDRYIYIHGTNVDDNIGTPKSAGCINLTNKEVLELFNLVEEGSIVLIDRY